jgi:hypothetical protein
MGFAFPSVVVTMGQSDGRYFDARRQCIADVADGNAATFSYTVNSVSQTKAIARQLFRNTQYDLSLDDIGACRIRRRS